jgi:hypothetical protein
MLSSGGTSRGGSSGSQYPGRLKKAVMSHMINNIIADLKYRITGCMELVLKSQKMQMIA